MHNVHTLRRAIVLGAILMLAGCGFHLRQSVALPAPMQHLHVQVDGDSALQQELARNLGQSGITLADDAGPGIAELRVPVARFSTEALTVSGYARVREYTVHYHVEFDVLAADGSVLLVPQNVEMQREFTYDQSQALGTATREEQIRASLIKDMARAILRRLQAAAETGPGA